MWHLDLSDKDHNRVEHEELKRKLSESIRKVESLERQVNYLSEEIVRLRCAVKDG